MDDYWQIIILSLIQGIAEVLPISSSAHLVLINQIFSLGDMNLGFAAALHGGSIIALFLWFRQDILWLWHTFWASLQRQPPTKPKPMETAKSSNNRFIAHYFLFSLIPTAISGILLKPIASDVFERPIWTAVFLIANGLIILAVAHWTHGERTLPELTGWEFLLIGLIQGLGVLPGISRLGITLCAGLFLRLNWYEALRLSFILAIPIIAGGILLEATTGGMAHMIANFSGNLISMALSSVAVIIISWFALKLLTRSWLERRTLVFFGYYCLMGGLFSLIYIVPTVIAVTS